MTQNVGVYSSLGTLVQVLGSDELSEIAYYRMMGFSIRNLD